MMMRLSAAFLALLAVADAQINTCTDDSTDDIVTLACLDANVDVFGTLCSALQDTNIDDTLSTDGLFTVFAPTNDAFTAAGRRIGVTGVQIQQTLKYHIVSGESDLVCDEDLVTNLFWLGVAQTVNVDCTAGVVDGVEGDFNLPIPATANPTLGTVVEACNGRIFPINNVLGFDPIQYDWNFQPCAFNEVGCIRPFAGKGGKGGLYLADQTVGGVNFQSVFYAPKASKWGALAPYQSVYANNANNYFAPYFTGGHYGPKAGKGGYGYGNNYYGGNGYGNQYYGGKVSKGYGNHYYGGKVAKGYGHHSYGKAGKGGYWWRNRRGLEGGEEGMMMEEEMEAEYEDEEEPAASTAGDYYYNYKKGNLRRNSRQ